MKKAFFVIVMLLSSFVGYSAFPIAISQHAAATDTVKEKVVTTEHTTKVRDSKAISAISFAIMSFIFWPLICGALAITFGSISLYTEKKHKGLALAAIIVGTLGILAAIVLAAK